MSVCFIAFVSTLHIFGKARARLRRCGHLLRRRPFRAY